MQMKRVIGSLVLFIAKAVLVVFIVFGLYQFGEYAYDFGHQLYSGQGVSAPPGKDVAVVIRENTTVSQISEMLERQGLIKDAFVFQIQERLSKYSGQMQAGNYVLNTSQSGEEMLAILSGHEEDLEDGKEQ